MRRQPLLLAFGLVVMATSVASGASTQNMTLSATVAEATWDTYNPDTGLGEFGGIQVARESGQTYAVLQRAVGELVLCEGADTPDDPSDDFYGFVGKTTFGVGTATVTVGRQYTSAKASGTVTVDVQTVNDCTGAFGVPQQRTVKFSLSVVAVSGLIKETSKSIVRVPSELTTHSQIRGVYREAAGTVKLGTVVIDADAIVGQVTLRMHETVH
jgi:hypothetical protein